MVRFSLGRGAWNIADMNVRGQITQRLVEKLIEEGNSVTDLGRLLHVTRQTIHGWRRGRPANPTNLHRLAQLASATTLDDLLNDLI